MLTTSNGSTEPVKFQQDLLKFPPILRKIALEMIKSDEILTIHQAVKAAGVSANAVRVATFRAKKKGNNFNELANKISNEKLMAYTPRVTKVLVEQALKGSFKHQELFYRLTGALVQDKAGQNTTINTLTFVLPMPSSIPQRAIPENNGAEDHTVIDVESSRDTEKVYQCPFCVDSFERLEMLGEHLSGEHKAE